MNFKNEFTKILEGKDIKTKLKQKFPDVIFHLLGPYEQNGEKDWYRLQMVLVPYKLRNKKLGTEFMKELIKLAKEEQRDIFLTPDDSYQEPGDMTKTDLIKWYKSLGFTKKRKDDFRSMDTMCYYT